MNASFQISMYDPDLCGSVPNFEDIIGREDLKIISAAANNMFLRHYAAKAKLLALENIGSQFVFSSGRVLQFIKTPSAHAQGSLVTFDAESGILFSSDLFGPTAPSGPFFSTPTPCAWGAGICPTAAACP